MPAASILIKPTSANCNMDCEYCFYKVLASNREEYSKGFMKEEILEELVKNAFSYAEHSVTFAFQGGEPTLAGIPFFEKAVEFQKKYNVNHILVENTIQTNGILIDEKWALFLKENHFLVGVSLDGMKKIHDKYRVDASKHEGTFERVMHGINLLEKYQVDYNILTVVTSELAKNASKLYQFYKKNGFSFIQLIPCMDESNRSACGEERNSIDKKDVLEQKTNLACEGSKVGAVDTKLYGQFLCEIFDLWYEDFCKGSTMDIRMFSNLAQMAAGFYPEQCGMNGICNCYFAVEGDGSVYPCDFYCMEEWKLGDVTVPFQEMATSKKATDFVEVSRPKPQKCLNCKFYGLCRGGCKRWRESVDGTISVNELCEAYQVFFAHTADRILKLGEICLRNAKMKGLI